MNFQIKFGRLCKNPEIRYTPSGFEIATLVIAENYSEKGEKKASFFYIKTLGESCNMVRDLTKGDSVQIEGYAKQRKYTDKNGVIKESMDFVATQVTKNPPYTSRETHPNMDGFNQDTRVNIDSDDLPF